MRNIAKMARKAEASRVKFRPHFKTHQSAEVGQWFRSYGVESITVSSLEMARYFAQRGWSDITVAFPVNLLEMGTIHELASGIDLGVLVDSEHTVAALRDYLTEPVGVWIKVDTGYGRVGVPWDQPGRILSLAKAIETAAKLRFEGLLTHSGHSYQARTPSERRKIYEHAVSGLTAIKRILLAEGMHECKISIGDTPTLSLADNFQGVDEIRPGNFVFNDVMQYTLGSCSGDEIAVAVACPVVGRYPDRTQIAVYGGAVHLGSEHIVDKARRRVFGYLTSVERGTLGPVLEQAPVVSLAQEHGIVELDRTLVDEIEIGDVVFILPVHSCLTCNLYREYRTLDGNVVARL